MLKKSDLPIKPTQDQRTIELRKLNDALKAGEARKSLDGEASKQAE